MKTIRTAAVVFACSYSAAVCAQQGPPASADLDQLARQLQHLNAADLQALQNKLQSSQTPADISALLRAAQNPASGYQLPGGLQGLLDGKKVEQLLREAAKPKGNPMSLQLNRPEYEYKIPTVGTPVLPSQPTQPGVTLPTLGTPKPKCELPPYCKHVTKPGPLCQCPEEDEGGDSQ
ncbi:hypothetical protein [Kordiimonas aestuarii]|uniref:hypothetical protein n=1 Tax=Kordiimonas aestuarii TaxID=1005925 RepID=UPI0021D17DA6|nr:hypothetical protein [Kordiimonas aestuarii]